MNKVILMGNLTRDPEVRYTSGENALAIARFSIAVQRRFQSRNSQNQNSGADVDFINCVAFGRTGENIAKFFTKGRKIAVSGRLQTSNWEDSNGQKRYGMDVIVEDFDFCDRKGDADGGAGYSQAPAYDAPAKPAAGEKFYDAADGVDDEDLPF